MAEDDFVGGFSDIESDLRESLKKTRRNPLLKNSNKEQEVKNPEPKREEPKEVIEEPKPIPYEEYKAKQEEFNKQVPVNIEPKVQKSFSKPRKIAGERRIIPQITRREPNNYRNNKIKTKYVLVFLSIAVLVFLGYFIYSVESGKFENNYDSTCNNNVTIPDFPECPKCPDFSFPSQLNISCVTNSTNSTG